MPSLAQKRKSSGYSLTERFSNTRFETRASHPRCCRPDSSSPRKNLDKASSHCLNLVTVQMVASPKSLARYSAPNVSKSCADVNREAHNSSWKHDLLRTHGSRRFPQMAR